MRNIGGNVGDARLGREDRRGGLLMSLLIVCASVCLLLPVYLCVCFDISVSYRAAVSP